MGSWAAPAIEKTKHAPTLRPLWGAIAWPIGGFLTARCWIIRKSSEVRIEGPGARYVGPAVYVNWHRHTPLLVGHHGERGRWMMVSAAPYIEPMARWCELSGLHIARGGSGLRGKEALGELRAAITRGESVFMAVDGPAGPAFRVKPGCVELARTTGVPIIAVAYETRRGRTVERRWDRLLIPTPLDRIVIRYSEPVRVDAETSTEEAILHVERALTALDPTGVRSARDIRAADGTDEQ